MNEQALTKEELIELTGYRRRSDQLKWLHNHHMRPFVSGLGQITLLWSVVRQAQLRDCGMAVRDVKRQSPEPRLKAIK